METMGKSDARHLLEDFAYGELETFIRRERHSRCTSDWRTGARDTVRRAMHLLFTDDRSGIEDVDQHGYGALRFTYILRSYGYGYGASVSYESDQYGEYMNVRFSVLRDGKVESAVNYEKSYGQTNGSYSDRSSRKFWNISEDSVGEMDRY